MLPDVLLVPSEQGVTPNPEKREKVTKWSTPTSLLELQGFLGLANYYRHFFKGYAEVAKPLHELSRKEKDFRWTKNERVHILKMKLTTSPILGCFFRC